MELECTEKDGTAVLMPKGQLADGLEIAPLDEKLYALLGLGKTRVVIDLSRTSSINSTGLSILIHQQNAFRNAGGCIKLAGLTERLKSILIITKLSQSFEVFDDVPSALSSFAVTAGKTS